MAPASLPTKPYVAKMIGSIIYRSKLSQKKKPPVLHIYQETNAFNCQINKSVASFCFCSLSNETEKQIIREK